MAETPPKKTPKRRGRGAPPVSNKIADAFTQDSAFAPRPFAHFLNDTSMDFLKQRVFALLEDYGVVVVHPKAHAAFLKAGAKQGADNNRLRLPRALVEEALAATPKTALLAGKKPELDLQVPRTDGGFIMRTGTGAHGYVDPRDTKYRNLDLNAVNDMAAVASNLDQIGFIAHPFVAGVPEVTADIHSYGRMTSRTDKHVWMQPYQWENIDYLMRIAAIAAGGEDNLRARPNTSVITCSFTPLEFKHMDTEVIIKAGKYGIPIHACSLPSGGGTAPLSVPAMALMAGAEILGMMTMAHILSPGTPVIATPLMFNLDMRTGSALQSSVESLQAANMAVQLMKQGFGMMAHTYGSGSDTPDVDHQSMAERALLMQNVALSGADILGGVGQLECATVFSPVQAVLDNEIAMMVKRFIRTPQIDEVSLNWDEVSSIRVGGHFLDSDHTVKECRDQLIPKVFHRDGRDDYEANERRGAFETARDQALQFIRDAPEEGVLSAEQNAEIASLTKRADKHIVEAYSGKVAVI